ncbi:MAG: RES family NAD+ phosphorylase, partial [Bryobacteraceae bacterium]
PFHDVRPRVSENGPYHDPASYTASQELAQSLLAAGSNGVLYRSVRRPGGECIACFRPALVTNVREDGHFEYQWSGAPEPRIRRLA